MDNDQIGAALGNATGLTRGLPSWKEGLAKLLEVLIDTPKGAIVGADPQSSPSQKLGELLSVLPMMGGLKSAQGVTKKGITAYHGSPHDFDKFSLSKIGTGEGAQAYGHGLYFAEAPEVAKSYQKKLAVPNATDSRMDSFLAKHNGDIPAAVDDLMRGVYDTPKAKEKMRATLVESYSKRPPTGRMYEVNINADPEDFLDWDAPAQAQSPKVQAALRAANLPAPMRGRGEDVYRTLQQRGPKEYKLGENLGVPGSTPNPLIDPAERLREAGIPGIKYLDGASRSAGQGSRNYVVFDDALIEIRRKYGFMLPIMGAAGFEQWSRQKAAEQTGVNPMDALAERQW